MAFRFYIDDQLVNQPANDKALTSTIKFNKELGALLITQEAKLQWYNNNDVAADEISAYTYLLSLQQDSVCSEAEIKIYDEVSSSETYLMYIGIIKIPSLEINEQAINVTTSVQDNSFYSYINNNKDIKVLLSGEATKNKDALIPPDKYSIDLFNGQNCQYGSANGVLFNGFHLVDAFTQIVSAISDNKIGFESNYLSALDPMPFIIKGQDLINPYTVYPTAEIASYEISFREIFTELNKIYNLNFYINVDDPNNPILKIEDAASFFDSNIVYDFNDSDIKEIRTTANLDNYYAKVNLGSEILSNGNSSAYTFNENLRYFAWNKEEFHQLGQCNTGDILDLVNQWVLSNNVIMETALLQATAHIDDYFLVECSNIDDVGLTAEAYQYDYFGQGGCYYNFGMNNITKILRHTTRFQTNLGDFNPAGIAGFRALLGYNSSDDITYVTSPGSHPNFIPITGLTVSSEFINVTTNGGYNSGNNYSVVTFRYTVPQDGVYSFHQLLNFTIANFTGFEFMTVIGTIIQYDQFGAEIARRSGGYTYGDGWMPANGSHSFDTQYVAYCFQDDYITAQYSIYYYSNGTGNQQNSRNITIHNDSYFECNKTSDGGITITGDKSLRVFIHEFKYSIPESDWRNIVANVNQTFTFTKDGVKRYGWINEMVHDHQTGLTNIKLITSNATITES